MRTSSSWMAGEPDPMTIEEQFAAEKERVRRLSLFEQELEDVEQRIYRSAIRSCCPSLEDYDQHS